MRCHFGPAMRILFAATAMSVIAMAQGSAGATPAGTVDPAGTDRVRFQPTDRYPYLRQYHGNNLDPDSGDPVTVTARSGTTGIDAVLQLGGKIAGRVTSAENGAPIAGVDVTTFGALGDAVPYDETDAMGVYTVTGLMDGDYRVKFEPPYWTGYLSQYYKGKSNLSEADPIAVTIAGVAGGIDVALEMGGTITGRVTSAKNSTSVAGAEVAILDPSGNPVVYPQQADASGDYTVPRLPGGDYRVRFVADGFTSQYYERKTLFEDAKPVVVVTGAVTSDIDAVLAPRGRTVQLATSPALSTLFASFENSQIPRYSLDGGATWHPVASIPWPNVGTTPAVAVAPRGNFSMPTRLIAAVPSRATWLADYPDEIGIWRTGDYGVSWAHWFPEPWPCYYGAQISFDNLVVSPADPRRLYVAFKCNYPWSQTGGIWADFATSDAGENWQEIPSYGYRIVPSPVLPARVYLESDLGWLQSDDGGQTSLDRDFPVDNLVLDAVDPARLYGVACDRSCFSDYEVSHYSGKRSQDGGATWSPWAEQPCASSFQQILAHPTMTNVLLMRCDQGLYRSRDGGESWEELSEAPGESLAADYGHPGRLLWMKDDVLWVSTDEGSTWTRLASWAQPSNLYLPRLTSGIP